MFPANMLALKMDDTALHHDHGSCDFMTLAMTFIVEKRRAGLDDTRHVRNDVGLAQASY